jgi:hypothetical protein
LQPIRSAIVFLLHFHFAKLVVEAVGMRRKKILFRVALHFSLFRAAGVSHFLFVVFDLNWQADISIEK